eukprot:TRINITY_DN33550_c0_g1_i1.p1 TRINITY_DN33550_c0_g1~~TRINITY_DN33550_c0_g1_i1.p1  ORF type:complete len:530 (-),score=82.81 TRINITY_DN33550_c0_g1_i1:285-1841(-)
MLCNVCSVVVMTRIAAQLAGSTQYEIVSPEQDAVLILAATCCLLLVVFQSRIQRNLADWVYGTLMLFCILGIVFADQEDPVAVWATSSFVFLVRAMIHQHYFQIKWVIIWNLVHAVVAICLFRDVPGLHRRANSGLELMAAALFADCAIRSRSHIIAELHQAVKVERQQHASRALLDDVCDVVLNLNNAFAISEQVPNFEAFVMNAGTSARGKKLQDFMPNSRDRDAFEDLLRVSSGGNGQVSGLMCCEFRDSLGNRMDVELFVVKTQADDLGISYMVGIRERIDDTAIKPLPEVTNRRASHHLSLRELMSSPAASGSKGTASSGDFLSMLVDSVPGSVTCSNASSSMPPASLGETPQSIGIDIQTPDSSSGTSQSSTNMAAQVPDPSADDSCEADSGHCARGLSWPHLKKSSPLAIDVSLLCAMLHWNLNVPRTFCCRFHAHTLRLKAAAKTYANMPCRHDFAQHAPSIQCTSCSFLTDHDDSLADWCCRCCSSNEYVYTQQTVDSDLSKAGEYVSI